MPGVTLPRSQAEGIGGSGGVIARTERVERLIHTPDRGPGTVEMIFSYAGILVADTESPPWYPRRGGSITLVRVSLLELATADHVIEVRVSGIAAQQFTLPSGDRTMSVATAIDLTPVSWVTVKTITVSDADLSVQMLAG